MPLLKKTIPLVDDKKSRKALELKSVDVHQDLQVYISVIKELDIKSFKQELSTKEIGCIHKIFNNLDK